MRALLLCLATCSGLAAGTGKAATDPSTFVRLCASCHGQDGGGKGAKGERLPGGRISDPARLASRDEDALTALILSGRRAMPGFRAKLGNEEARKLAKQVLKGLQKTR
jgi:mono/diheme cytochrome c family protein